VPANTGISEEAVRAQVARLLAWEGLVGADRLGRFLEFTTEKVLSGRVEDIKEYTLGVEVCGRPDSFDPRVESVVRNTASRLRTKLTEYYLTAGRLDPVEIELPKADMFQSFASGARQNLVSSLQQVRQNGRAQFALGSRLPQRLA
jgi:hypothetical protein